MASTLYAIPHNFLTQKILIAAQYSGAAVKLSENFVFGETNKSNEFLKKFPNGKVPALETSENKYLSESYAIAYYVGNDRIRGATVEESAQILQWLSFGDNEILPPARAWIFPLLGVIQYNKQSTEKAKEDVKRVLKVLNDHLLTRTYLVGECITLADISVCCNLLSLYRMVLESSFRSTFRNVNRWFTTLVNQPQFKTVLGNVTRCEKMNQYDDKNFADILSKLKDEYAKPKEEKKDEKKGKKEQELKLKYPFDASPEGTFIMDEFERVYNNEDGSITYFFQKYDPDNHTIWHHENLLSSTSSNVTKFWKKYDRKKGYDLISKCRDEYLERKKKREKKEQELKLKDPFDAFPEGTFIMDEFKRVYSNEDKKVSIKYFWEKFDPENYSIWYCEYLFAKRPSLARLCWKAYDERFKLLDEMRKNAFASVCLFGEDYKFSISAIWVWRGHQLAFTLFKDCSLNYKSYSWKKLNPSTEETKKLVSEYLAWAGDFGGKKFNQGKIFS